MNRLRTIRLAAVLFAAGIAWTGPAAAARVGVCLECHGDTTIGKSLPDGGTLSLHVDEKAYRRSVHGRGPCTACHTDASADHGALRKVSCERCHVDTGKSYALSSHGKLRDKGIADSATCHDCHGKHDILGSKNPASRTFRLNIAAGCLGCHKDGELEQRYGLPGEQVMVAYEKSVHGMALSKGGLLPAAVCTDCHGNHAILPGDQPRSATHRQKIPTMCGKCHTGIEEEYERSIHGRGMRGGIPESPVCTDCHGEHTIIRKTDPASPAHARNVPRTCASCHDKEEISSRYALPKKRFSTYMDSFHGIFVELGMTKAANCASCHGYHEILPSSDPASPVHKDNISRTCGKCHPNAGPNFAKGPVHVEVTPRKALGVFAVRAFYTLFISSLVVLFALHIGMDLLGRRRRGARKGKEE
jgi:hypothetical protein